jgi:hypothetical protein
VGLSKRASGKFKRRAQDAYDTPPEAVEPLIPHLPARARYWEPCAGNGALINALAAHDMIDVARTDICPRDYWIQSGDAMKCPAPLAASYIITNPPWTRGILHPMIEHFTRMRPTWLLFDADWMHTKQAVPFLKMCAKIVSVGRVSWMGNGVGGFDNCAWYLFDQDHIGPPVFWGRA